MYKYTILGTGIALIIGLLVYLITDNLPLATFIGLGSVLVIIAYIFYLGQIAFQEEQRDRRTQLMKMEKMEESLVPGENKCQSCLADIEEGTSTCPECGFVNKVPKQ